MFTYSVPSLIVRNAVRCCLQTCKYGFCKELEAYTLVLLLEAVCCLQTCKCGFDIRVVLCTSVLTQPSYRHKYCLTLFVVVYKLVIHDVLVGIPLKVS